jgi:hypothetical protein
MLYLFSKHRTVSQYMRRYNLIYAGDKGTAFPASIFTAIADDQQHDVQISDIEFHQTRTTHVEGTDKNSYMFLKSIIFNAPFFTKCAKVQRF